MRKVKTVTADQLLVNLERLSTTPDKTLEHGLRAIQKELWVRRWYALATVQEENGNAVVKTHDQLTIVAIDNGPGAPLMGWAKCIPSDTRSTRIGIAVAIARAYGEEIPDYI